MAPEVAVTLISVILIVFGTATVAHHIGFSNGWKAGYKCGYRHGKGG